MTIDQQNTVVIAPAAPTAAVIFLHGLAQNAHEWAKRFKPIVAELPHVKFILPTAAARPVTLLQGASATAWYDLLSNPDAENDSADGIETTQALILHLIEKEVAAGTPYNRIVLAGFSQGGASSLFTGYQMKHALAGVIALSCYLPQSKTFEFAPETADVPLLMCHGDQDSVVSLPYATQCKQKLETDGVKNVTFNEYVGLEHVPRDDELEAVKAWLRRILSAQ